MNFLDFLTSPLAWLLLVWVIGFTGGLYLLCMAFVGWLDNQEDN